MSWPPRAILDRTRAMCSGMGGKVAIGLDRGATMRPRLTSAFKRRRLVPSGAAAAEAHALGAASRTVRGGAMAENKTKPTGASVEEYIASRANEEQRADCKALMSI